MITEGNLALQILENEVEHLQRLVTDQAQKIVQLEEQLAWFQRQIFGKRSERIIDENGEQQLFPGFEPSNKLPEKKQTIPEHVRKQPNRMGQDKIILPPNIPVETKVIDLPESQKICPETGIPFVKIGEEVSQRLAQKPGSFFIKQIIRPKYAHPHQEERGVLIAELPDSIIPKCRADESFLAHIVVQKFADHLLLYRISDMLQRDGIQISRKLLSQWVVRLGTVLHPLYEVMRKKILASNNIFIDESPVRFMEKESKTGYMWTIVGGEGPNPPYRIYDFRNTRQHDHVLQMLKDYRGVLYSDKYGAYEALAQTKQVIWCPCWAHIRRKFFEAETDPPFREWMLSRIQKLFDLEKNAWAQPPDERLRIRKDDEVPIIDEMIAAVKQRLVEGTVLPKSKYREALGYFYGLIPYLKNYTLHTDAHLDNNVAERAIRPLAIGRKNWLFFGSSQGGKAGSVLLSLVQSCRALEINPREYLEDLFRRFMGHNACRLDELLPDQWAINNRSHQ